MALTSRAPFNRNQFNSFALANVHDAPILPTVGSGAIAESPDVVVGSGAQTGGAALVSSLSQTSIGPKSSFSKFRGGLSGFSAPPTVAGSGAILESPDVAFGIGSGPGYKISSLDPKRIGPQSPFSKFRDQRIGASLAPVFALNSGAIVEGPDFVAGTGLFLIASTSYLSSANLGPGFDGPFNLNQFKALQQGATSKPVLAGSGSIAELPDIVAGTGASAYVGSGSILDGADIVSGAGTLGGQGVGAILEPGDVVAGSGIQSAIGSGAIADGSDVVVGVGAAGVNGLGAIAEAQDLVSGAGIQSTSGAGAITEGNDIVAGTGNAITSSDGNGAIAELGDAVAGLGSAAVSAFGAILELPDLVSGFGFVGNLLFGGPRYVVRRVRGRPFTISATMSKRFNVKDPEEEIKLTFDFTPDLQMLQMLFGVSLASAVAPIVEITNYWGGDTVPTLAPNGAAGFDVTLTKVIVPVLGGLDENDYQIRVVAQTTDPQTVLELTGILPVRMN